MSRITLNKADWDLQRSRLDQFFRVRVHDENDVDDLTHEVIEHAFAHCDTFDPSKGRYTEPDDQVGAWLKGIATYKLAEFITKKRKEKERLEQFCEQGFQELDSVSPSAENKLDARDIIETLQEALEDCSPALKEVARYKFQGMSVEEIAKQCFISMDTAYARISRLQRKIKERLEWLEFDNQPQVIFTSEINYYQAVNQFLNEQTMVGCGLNDADSLKNYVRHVNKSSRIDDRTGELLKKARRAIERNDLTQEDMEYTIEQLNQLTTELQKRKVKPTALKRYWNHIKEVAPTVASILSTIAAIAKFAR